MKKYAFWIEVLSGGVCGFLVYLPNFPQFAYLLRFTMFAFVFLPSVVAVLIYAVLRAPERITIVSAVKLGALACLPLAIWFVIDATKDIDFTRFNGFSFGNGLLILVSIITVLGNTASGLILGLLITLFYRLSGLLAKLYERFQSKNKV